MRIELSQRTERRENQADGRGLRKEAYVEDGSPEEGAIAVVTLITDRVRTLLL